MVRFLHKIRFFRYVHVNNLNNNKMPYGNLDRCSICYFWTQNLRNEVNLCKNKNFYMGLGQNFLRNFLLIFLVTHHCRWYPVITSGARELKSNIEFFCINNNFDKKLVIKINWPLGIQQSYWKFSNTITSGARGPFFINT